VLADHGFIMTPKAICPNVLLRKQGLLRVTGGKIEEARVHVIPEGGIGLVYYTNPADAVADAEAVQKLFRDQEGVADVILPDRFAEYGLPHPREYGQAPNAVLVAKDGYAVSATIEGDEFIVANTQAKTSLGSHGFLSTNSKMNALCVLSGKGVHRGGKVVAAENIDIAPTIARLLGLEFPTDGKGIMSVITP
jgi:hypothetical protein